MTEITPEIAEICGIHAGDGYMRIRENGKGEVSISGNLEEKEYYDNHVIPLFNNTFKLDIKGKFFSGKTYGFISYQEIIRNALISNGFPKGKKTTTVKVPQPILESNNNAIKARFLRGLFDTDGNLYFRKSHKNLNEVKNKQNHYPIIKLTTTSRYLAEGTIKILEDLDIIFFFYTIPKKEKENKKFIITISGLDGLSKWMDLIGMKNNVKLSRYLIWKKFGFCPANLSQTQREDILNGKINPLSIGP